MDSGAVRGVEIGVEIKNSDGIILMFKKVGLILKRLFFGYVFFFLLILAGLTIELPFALVIIVGMGLIPIDGFPFPRDIHFPGIFSNSPRSFRLEFPSSSV